MNITENFKGKLEECISTNYLKWKKIFWRKKNYNLSNFGGNIIYSKIHIIVKIDGKENGNRAKIMEDISQYISNMHNLNL